MSQAPDAATVDQQRIDAARRKVERVAARLRLADAEARAGGAAGFMPSERRLLQDALDLLDPEVKLA